MYLPKSFENWTEGQQTQYLVDVGFYNDNEPIDIDQKQIIKSVYFAAPLWAYHRKEYGQILNKLRTEYSVIDVRTCYKNGSYFNAKYKSNVKKCQTWLVYSPNGYVGMGCYTEYLYARKLNLPCYRINPKLKLTEIEIEVVDKDNWQDGFKLIPISKPKAKRNKRF
jgi:hypothetical protein